MGFHLFKPRGATKKNYIAREKDLYIALETLKEVCKQGKIEKDCYVVTSSNPSYRRAFDLSYSLVKFYTKFRDESKEFMFKRNFLLTKTRGLFSHQENEKAAFADIYYVKCELMDSLPSTYLKMFHLNKSFGEELPEDLDYEKTKDKE
jgi:hypothetical protein